MYIKNICHNFYVAFLYLPFCLSFFVYPIMLINTLFCLFDLMLHTYMCLCDCSKNWRCIYWPRHLHLWFMVNLVDILYLFILKPFLFHNGQGAWVAQWARSLDLTAHTSLSPIWHGFVPSFVNNKKGCTRLAAASDKVYQLPVQGRWFSPGTLASSNTKTGRHDNISEILLKVVLKHQKIKINHNGQIWES
jgi:hypothetical protein